MHHYNQRYQQQKASTWPIVLLIVMILVGIGVGSYFIIAKTTATEGLVTDFQIVNYCDQPVWVQSPNNLNVKQPPLTPGELFSNGLIYQQEPASDPKPSNYYDGVHGPNEFQWPFAAPIS